MTVTGTSLSARTFTTDRLVGPSGPSALVPTTPGVSPVPRRYGMHLAWLFWDPAAPQVLEPRRELYGGVG